MYKYNTSSNSNSSRSDITKYVSGNDIFNSQLLYELNRVTELIPYQIKSYQYRPDLICSDIDYPVEYEWILLFINKIDITEYRTGEVIYYIPRKIIDNLIQTL